MICAAVEHCAGIDVGKKVLDVCIMVGPLEGEPRMEYRKYGTNRADLEQLKSWLLEEGITHVVMESTGSYWKPVFNVLEGAMQVYLANSQEVKNRKGHKTDKNDAWWLAHLLRHAMIRPSFIPPRAVRQLRDLTRRRKKILGAATSERNRVQKMLEDANVKLGNVLSDIFGVSGQFMLDALLEGKAGPEEIAGMAQRSAKRKIPQIIAALDGHLMNDPHRRMIRYSLEHLSYLEEQIAELDGDIVAQIEAAGMKKQLELIQSVPGIGPTSAATILAETGPDMSVFPTPQQFSSWAGVCPGNNRSAGKNRSSHTTGGNPWLRSALTEVAWAASNKNGCFLKEKFWRITTKSHGKKAPAVIAVAHVILILIYKVLTTETPYKERGSVMLDEHQKQRLIRHHVRRLGKLGIAVSSCRPRVKPQKAAQTKEKKEETTTRRRKKKVSPE